MTQEVIRTRLKGCYRKKADPFGTAYEQIPDPLAQADEPPPFVFSGPKIGADHWTRIFKLFDYLAKPNETTGGVCEVQVILARPVDEDLGLPAYRVFVPKQQVSKGEVDAQNQDLVDLETGERLTKGLTKEWADAGTVHSHNDMNAFWSGTDDADQVKRWGLHLVVGKLDQPAYEVACRVTRRKQVVDLKWKECIEEGWVDAADYHPGVLKQIELQKPTVGGYFFGAGGFSQVCVFGRCLRDRDGKSYFCTKHQTQAERDASVDDRPFCKVKSCSKSQAVGSDYCTKHTEAKTQTTRPLFETNADETVLDVAWTLESYVKEHGALDQPTVNALIAAVLCRAEKGVQIRA